MKVEELRQSFLDFFKSKGHTIVASSPLVPHNDETLLFTNAGMVQFKEVFLGLEKRSYTKAASSQRCVRAGGKHNDLENVGYTARHHTFFEMLGNFSFGDYFKKEAIAYAWEFLTGVLKLPKEKLWISVYEEDIEAESIWLNEIGIDKNRISRCGAKDNFWSMGDTGPCGPCTEIYYDHGAHIPGGPPGSPDEEGDRYIEIWNLVFMQFNRQSDGTMTPLPKPSVDTGMGLERVAAVMQHVHNNYEIDLFANIIKATAKILNVKSLEQKALRVIADHIRSTSFLILDGVLPSNEGRGYVLRRIMRRALRYGNELGAKEPFFYKIVGPLVKEMGHAYPDLAKAQDKIEKVILKEEEQFARTLSQGLKILEDAVKSLKGQLIEGELLFKLYDTYGFPVDLTADYARERGLRVDIAGFESEMAAQRERARSSSQFGVDYTKNMQVEGQSEFTGYHSLEEQAEIIAVYNEKEKINDLKQGERGSLILGHTPFYAESGGQVGDKGIIESKSGRFIVEDTQKQNEAIVHIGYVKNGSFKLKDTVSAKVDKTLRDKTRLNHSATHLLHAALREIIGTHIVQKGSLVEPQRLRFDYSHFEALTPEQIKQVEDRVNEKILENSEATVTEMSPQEAIKAGAMALFGEKYGDKVRVLNMGHGYSVELCGGTHTERTGDIGIFKITSESGIAAGVRRIEALTGTGAIEHLTQADDTVSKLTHLLKTDREALSTKIISLLDKQKELEKENQRLKAKLASGGGGTNLSQDAVVIGDIKLLVKRLTDANPQIMRQIVDEMKNKLGKAVVVLAAQEGDKVQLIVGVTKAETSKISAGDLVNFIANQVGGKGGGRPDLAQAGGTQPENLDQALNSVADWVKQRI